MKQSVFVRRLGRPGLVPLLLWMLAGGPEAARAQWVEAPGSGWVQVAVYHHDTRRRFDEQGRTRRLFNEGGRSIATSVFVTAVAGLVRGADVWVQVPFHRLAFNDVVEERTRAGFGDVRLHGRIGPSLFGLRSPVPVAVRAGVKLATGDYTRDAEIIPLAEGQRDGEVLLELGHSFWPRPLYLSGWVGYRWREENAEAAHDPGDEWFYFVTLGGTVAAFEWKLSLDGLYGRTPRFLGLAVPSSRRRLVQLLPSLGRPVGPGVLELGARIPLSGRNLPAGPALLLGYFWTWGR
ncbi:MAG: transporter [Bacteroidetes bacterium]|nr:MAG: transporter [Bacteroidota bacterium]